LIGFPIRIWFGGYGVMFDDYSLVRFYVAVVLIEAAGHFYGAEYGVAAGIAVAGSFDEAIEGAADFDAAQAPEAAGVGMAVESGEAWKIVVPDDAFAPRPVEEGFVDGFAFGVVADGAFAGVAVFGGCRC
jgi:hypothetical protein